MEDVEKTVKTTLDFLGVVQKNCDSRRRVLEQLLKTEFLKFNDQWEKNALEVNHKSASMEVKGQTDNDLKAIKDDSKQPYTEPELEELVQANILLKRARNLRENFKLQSISDEESSTVQCQSNHHSLTTAKQRTKFAEFAAVNGMCSSKSEPVLSHITHSKQSSIKRPQNSLITELGKKASVNSLSVTDQRTNRSQSVSVITKKELMEYKQLRCNIAQSRTNLANLKLSSSLGGVRGKKIESNGECKKAVCVKVNDNVRLDKRKKPSIKDFQCAIKTNTLGNMTLKPNLFHCLWYPFLSSSNAMCLSLQLSCSSYKELRHVYTLYHQIQEMLYMLDLYSLVGKALHTQPTDCRNQNFLLIRSYLRSVFHENMQQTPIILPPDAS